MNKFKKIYVYFLKKIDLGSALAVRLTKLTGKSKRPLHPKHLIASKSWFLEKINKSDIVLDLGCGNCQNTIKAAKKVKRIIGIDFDQKLLNIAKSSSKGQKINNIIFKKANLEEKLSLKDDIFDKVLFLDVLEHLENRDQILKEIKRVLKPNGLLFLGVPNNMTSWKKFQRSAGICSFSDKDHKIEYSEKSIRKLLKNHNFKIIKFGYGKYDTPLKGLIDLIGGFSLTFYRIFDIWRSKISSMNKKEASGFEIISINMK